MAQETEALAIGIGVQVDQATVNPNVRDATQLVTTKIPTAPTADEATGIFIRNDSDLSQTHTRDESDGGRVPGSLTRMSGFFRRVVPAVSFPVFQMGSLVAIAGAPSVNDFDPAEYMFRILAMVRLEPITPTVTESSFQFAANADNAYHTVKIWRGLTSTESWTLVGCTANLTFTDVAGEPPIIGVELVADSVIYREKASETFPSNATSDLDAAFGNQRKAPPIVGEAIGAGAAASLAGVTRGFQTMSLTVGYDVVETPDSNAANGTGITNSQGTRQIAMDATWFGDTLETAGDFLQLSNELDQTGVSAPSVTWRVGTQSTATGEFPNAIFKRVPSLRVETNVEVFSDANKVLRQITGYAAVSGDTGFGDGGDEEFLLNFT